MRGEIGGLLNHSGPASPKLPTGDDGSPRVLLITDHVPGDWSGYAMRVANVIEGLASVGQLHVLLVDVSPTGERISPTSDYTTESIRSRRTGRLGRVLHSVRLLPSDVHYRRTRELRRAITEATGHVAWDLVWCSRARTHVLARHVPTGPRIVDLDDLNDLLLRSEIRDRTEVRGKLRALGPNLLDRADARKWGRLQRRISAQADAVAVCSHDDREHLGVPNAVVVPNGYPDPGPAAVGNAVSGTDDSGTRSRPSILFAGAMTYEPNRLAVEWFVRRVLPKILDAVPDAVLELIGHPHPHVLRLRDEHVVMAGHVPDVTPHYAAASLAVAPIHSGGGTRLKVIEPLARGVPLVATRFAASGLGLVDGVEVLLADDEHEYARACISLLRDPVQRREQAAAGRRRFERDLDAASSQDAVAALASDVIGRRPLTPALLRDVRRP